MNDSTYKSVTSNAADELSPVLLPITSQDTSNDKSYLFIPIKQLTYLVGISHIYFTEVLLS